MTGSAVQWLRDQLGIISGAAQSESLARQVRGQRRDLLRAGVLRVCSRRTGGRTPAARSSVCPGSTPTRIWPGRPWSRSATRPATWWRRCSRTPGSSLDVLRVDGGVTANELCMQMQADILGVPVSKPVVAETTALGAAYAAGLAVGLLEEHRRAGEQLERGPALAAGVERRAARPTATQAGRRQSSGRWIGWTSTDHRLTRRGRPAPRPHDTCGRGAANVITCGFNWRCDRSAAASRRSRSHTDRAGWSSW